MMPGRRPAGSLSCSYVHSRIGLMRSLPIIGSTNSHHLPGNTSMNWKLAIGIALLVAATAAHAGGTYVGRIRPVHYGVLYLDATATQVSNRPACATRGYVRLQENPTDAAYKEKFSMILAAW